MSDYLIKIAQFQGQGWISKLVRLQTDSNWSHTACILRDNSVIESWHRGGVSHVKLHNLDLQEYEVVDCLGKNHRPGTPVDLFGVWATDEEAEVFEDFLLSHVGEKYDFWAVFRFLTRKPFAENDRWFCSELISQGLVHTGIRLQERIRCYKMSPQLVGISPLLIPLKRLVTI